MHSGSTLTPNNPAFSISIGIASLVLEGRPLSDDDFARDISDTTPTILSTTDTTNSKSSQSSSHQNSSASIQLNSITATAATTTTTAATTVTPVLRQDTVQHIQRLRQKLLLLRSTPSTSRGDHVEQTISIVSGSTASGYDSDEELEMIYKKHLPHQSNVKSDGNVLSSLQSLATSCLKTTSTAAAATTTPRTINNSAHSGLLKTVEPWSPMSASSSSASSSASSSSSSAGMMVPQKSCQPITKSSKLASSFSADAIKKKCLDKGTTKQHGPHCEQFLKKIGLIKDINGSTDVTDFDEHFCTDTNENCFRWQIHYRQLVSVFSRGDPICIEVYLGPENHVILLEQWIIQQCIRENNMTMTLQSLCSAIRSQLYFSQITAWTDLLRSTSQFDTTIKNNPRLKLSASYKPKLDILYRIRPYDSTSCFNDRPNIHNFPDAIVSGNMAVKVCLKSLPRMQSIPRLQDEIQLPEHLGECSSHQSMMFDDRLNYPCMEKGKHRCGFDEDVAADEMEATPATSLSHRDRQLQKYKKRIMKRDKKKRTSENSLSDEGGNSCQQHHCGGAAGPQPSVAGVAGCKTSANQLYEQTSINSIRPPLYSSSMLQLLASNSTQTTAVETRSVSTQTDLNETLFPNCDFCGIEMQYLCWNCDNNLFMQPNQSSPKRLHGGDLLLQAIQRTPSVKQSSMLSKMGAAAEGGRFAGGTVQKPMIHDKKNRCIEAGDNKLCDRSNCDSLSVDLSDCRLCKRQKTVHNYNKNNNNNNNNNNNINNKQSMSSLSMQASSSPITVSAAAFDMDLGETSGGVYRRTMSESLGNTLNETELAAVAFQNGESVLMPEIELKKYRRAYSEDVLECLSDDDNAINNTTNVTTTRPKQLDLENHHHHNLAVPPKLELPFEDDVCSNYEKQQRTPPSSSIVSNKMPPNPTINIKTNPLYVTCSDVDMNPTTTTRPKAMMGKEIPKVNLSKVFSVSPISPWDHFYAEKRDFPTSSPISITSAHTFNFETASPTSSINSMSIGGLVHKSNSAPTFPNSPVLSPRFLKSAAIHKRRSRHLSDRSSERSSIGSDEQFSDEELGFGLDNTYSPVISPTKITGGSSSNGNGALKPFPRLNLFARKVLLGSYEEALLQRCFKPKCQIYGFKVLLGASGGFCPTQMTLASSTFFYELEQGASLSTPYTCEIRLPRKGYSVPRVGTVQATLLNPLGMVVRMFVVPYDFRDMPNMSQTFIRQRVLAFDESSNPGTDVRTLSAVEQMKILRYAIHLRFQTSRSGRLALHTDIRMLILRRTDCDTAAAHAKDALESPNELKIVTVAPTNPKFSPRLDKI